MSKQEISFTATEYESGVIREIADRAVALARKYDIDYPVLDATMDLLAVHSNGNALRLEELRDAPDFDFAHDIFGIRRHLDRETGQLGDCFCPRFSAPQEVAA